MKLGNANKTKANVNIFQYLTAARLINDRVNVAYFDDIF